MINLSRLLFDAVFEGDHLRYRENEEVKPIVVWNITRRCNLKCRHCYSESEDRSYAGEFSPDEVVKVLDELVRFRVPVLLFSGGEPLIRPDILNLIKKSRERGLRPVVSTNGTLIDRKKARGLREAGVAYVGVSLDGLEEKNDFFRKVPGAYRRGLAGIKNCQEEGVKTGLRFTITRYNREEIPGIFDLVEAEGIERVCFYHLVYSGRGSEIKEASLSAEESRSTIDTIISRTEDLYRRGKNVEVLTVDNHCDGPYLYLKAGERDPERARKILELLRINGGNRSGIAIAGIDSTGEVYPDQFWRNHSLGNVRGKSFSEIWEGKDDSLLKRLREKPRRIKGKCAACRFLDICNGNFRARAEAVYRDAWESDPACYLYEQEIRGNGG